MSATAEIETIKIIGVDKLVNKSAIISVVEAMKFEGIIPVNIFFKFN